MTVYIDHTHFEEMVRKELNGLATNEEQLFLWQDFSTINRWKTVLEEMRKTAETYLKKWSDEYQEEEQKYVNAIRGYKRTEWELYCQKHDERMKKFRSHLAKVKERERKIWAYFNENKQESLYTTILPASQQEEVAAALSEVQTRQEKMLAYQEEQTLRTRNWGYGLRNGWMFAATCMQELWVLGYSPYEAIQIMKEYSKYKLNPWIPHARGEDVWPVPDFQEFLFEKGYHTGPRK